MMDRHYYITLLALLLLPAFPGCIGAEQPSDLGADEMNADDQPSYFFPYEHNTTEFYIGFVRRLDEERDGRQVPRVMGERIYDHWVFEDDVGRPVKMTESLSQEFNIGRDVGDTLYFLSGHTKLYSIQELHRENPSIEELKYMSRAHMSIFQADNMFETGETPDALTVKAPDAYSNEFEFTVAVKNTLDDRLEDSRLHVDINPSAHKLVREKTGEDSPSTRISSSYYNIDIRDRAFQPGQEKEYVFRIMLREQSRISVLNSDHLNITISFRGYAKDEEGENPFKPVYDTQTLSYTVALNNDSICNKIENPGWQGTCKRMHIPEDVKEAEDCEEAGILEREYACIGLLAERHNRPEYCREIEYQDIQKACTETAT
ncbi:MAG: hypothetical protein GF416_02510 [Candidatus Altiarchaeales archaeon]|nr:hypothetical protein [Candidatus Altiarchaeales archaeon]MBD3415991.1 hypothetical protein [Candidatus Altiarchaeales archaeon]